jgi:hypothetical protein
MHLPPNNDTQFSPPPAGTHVAVCYRVIDLGTQQVEWQGSIKHQRKVLISWELSEEKMEDGRPFTVGQRYTLSSHEKSRLRKDLEAWRGKKFSDEDFGPGGFDIKNIIGKACMLSIVHNAKDGKTYANIASVSALPRSMNAPALVNEPVYFSLGEPRLDTDTFDNLTDGLKNVIKTSPEYMEHFRDPNEPPSPQSPNEYGANGDPLDDSIPF